MNITPEQVARLIFNLSNMRYFQKEFQADPCKQNRDLLVSFQGKVDEFLYLNQLTEFSSYEEILDMLTHQQFKQAI